MRKIKLALAMTFAVCAPALNAAPDRDPAKIVAGTYELDPSHTSVVGRISHLGLSNFTFDFDASEGSLTYDPANPAKVSLTASVDAASVDTGVEKLDNELAGEKFFDAARFPKMTFVGKSLRMGDAGKGVLDGELTLHGKTMPVAMAVTFNGAASMGGADKLGFSGTMTIKRSDYGITAMVGPIGDTVEIAIETEFVRKQ